MGLEGVGMLREPTVLVLGLRIDSLSSLSPAPSPTPLGLLLGCVDPGTAGPPETTWERRRQNNLIKLNPGIWLISVICLTEVRVPSLAVVCRGTALCLVARGGRRCTRGGGGRGVFAGSVGDGTGADSS